MLICWRLSASTGGRSGRRARPRAGPDEEADRLSDEPRAIRDKLDKVRPRTLRGVLAVLDLGADLIDDPDWEPVQAIEGLREIVEQGGAA
jgi:hypothetical protein